MHTRNIFYLLVGLLLIALPISAQETPNWSIYLFDNIDYNLIRVDADGDTQTFSLAIEENSFLSMNQLAINQDGTQTAFCKETRISSNSMQPGQKTVVVRDIVNETDLLTLDYGTPYGCSVSMFSEDASLIAVSLVHELPYMPDFVDTSAPTWELQLVDVMTGNIIKSINSDNLDVPAFTTFGADIPMMAQVRFFAADTVRYAGLPFIGVDGPPEVPVYEWNLSSGSIIEMPPSTGRFNSDYLIATGELAYAVLDENLDAVLPGGPLPQANIVNIRNEAGDEQTVYQNTEWVISRTSFINNGQSLAISLLGAWDENNPELSAMARYEVLNRDGSIQRIEANFDGYKEIVGVDGGAVLTWTINPTQDGYQPTYVAFWNGTTLNTVVEFTPDYVRGFSPPMLIWATPMNITNASLASFDTIE